MSLRTRKQPGDEQHVFLDLGGKDETVRSVRTRSKSGKFQLHLTNLSRKKDDYELLKMNKKRILDFKPLLHNRYYTRLCS